MSIPVEVPSPCIDVCTLDATGRLCIGCYRTLDEIVAWVSLGNAQRARVVAALPERRRGYVGTAGTVPQRCSHCGAQFGCGAKDPHNACWCTRYPPVTPRAGQSCLCPACLAAAAT